MSRAPSACYPAGMQHALKARVRNGRLVLDEPTDLPEGAEVELVPADSDDLTPEEREELHNGLRESIAQMREGRLSDGKEVIAELRKRA
jgi:hypothetical protein